MAVCSLCGQASERAEPPLTWASSVEGGQTRHYCEQCARENLRAIEAKLDAQWW
ncbi:MAG TPA: hypothetical protein VFI30_01750 [Nocardioidaceae bacterium]|nr:hypothetical protein [Nocardioidaceae bacterium]